MPINQLPKLAAHNGQKHAAQELVDGTTNDVVGIYPPETTCLPPLKTGNGSVGKDEEESS